jgi:hypothetical protein
VCVCERERGRGVCGVREREREGGRVCVRERERERGGWGRVCVWEREGGRVRMCVCVCVREREWERGEGDCVCVREREREGESVCVCEREREGVCVCVCERGKGGVVFWRLCFFKLVWEFPLWRYNTYCIYQQPLSTQAGRNLFISSESDVTFKYISSENYVCSYMKDWLSVKFVF